MKLIKTATGFTMQITQQEWENIGVKEGWLKSAQAVAPQQGNPPQTNEEEQAEDVKAQADQSANMNPQQGTPQGQEGGTFGPGPTGIKDMNPQPAPQQANPAVAPAIGQQPVAQPAPAPAPVAAPAAPQGAPQGAPKPMLGAPQPSPNAPRFHTNPNQVVPQGGKKREDREAASKKKVKMTEPIRR